MSATTSVNSSGTGARISASNSSEGNSPPANTHNTALNMAGSLPVTNKGLGGSNRTRSGTPTTSLPTGLVTYAVKITNSQGSVTNEIVQVGYSSGVPSTNASFAYVDSVMTTVTIVPIGVSIQTITTSTCTTAGAIITATSSGSTIATEVPELCTHGLAFLIFGLPGFHSSSEFPFLCHKLSSFPLGIIWRLFCPLGGPPTISIISIDPSKLPPGENPNGDNPDDETPTPTQSPSQTMQSMVSSSAAETPTRCVVMPLVNTAQSATNSLFAPYAQRKDVTQANRSDGTLEFFALELSDTEASVIDADSDFIIIQESELEIEMPDSGQTDLDLNGTIYATEPLDSNPNVGSRDLHDGD